MDGRNSIGLCIKCQNFVYDKNLQENEWMEKTQWEHEPQQTHWEVCQR